MAIAPQRAALGIRRHFTRAEVHPYDELTWELRDARITNFRDGSVAFEQRDVEVPASWSLNATNILAQKYFRGTPGTPERERSLRQVVDRVVNTITEWGEKDGYFEDDGEAETFRAELTHLVVNQKAAFNSPVWFNIGVAGVPQQGSACQPYDALVNTDQGLVPIGQLVEEHAVGTKVLDIHGLTRILAVKHNGQKRVLRIHTKTGHHLDVTGDHLVWRATGDYTGRFVPADELRRGDALLRCRVESFGAPAKRHQIDHIEPIGLMDVYDIQTESGEYLCDGIRVHNCFILSVDDTMDSILNWYTEEGVIFKGGSGAGVNLSRIRSSHEFLKGGGTASGPVSFMRGADASAGTIKSGGKTRRAAKMVILDADHPDIEDFIWCKAIEERKARVLRDAGFDMDLDGKDSISLQYQNANNSVRVTDEFMAAVVDGRDWALTARTGEVLRRVPARDLFRQIAQAAWECADPGMQFDSTINRWNTAANTGRINGSNPCFPGSARVHTDKGLIQFSELFDRANRGEQFGVYTHDATNPEAPVEQMLVTTPEAFMITGFNPIVRLRFDNGAELRCTPGHRIFTINRGYVEAHELTTTDEVKLLDLAAPAEAADPGLPVSSDPDVYRTKGDRADLLRLPDRWTEDFAHYLGWLIGDGSTSGSVVATIYGSAEDRDEVLPRHAELVEWINGDRPLKVSEQANGTAQLRLARRPFRRFIESLGVRAVKGPEKRVPWAVEQAPSEAVAAFLRGLFDADGCVVLNRVKGSYVGLGSSSRDLLRDVQVLLSTFGIFSRVYRVRERGSSSFEYTAKDGSVRRYGQRPAYDLRITSSSIDGFARHIGFSLGRKQSLLRELIIEAPKGFYDVARTARLTERTDEGTELTYNLSEPRNHSYVVDGVVVRNCSEYMHLDNSACNLASLNLLTFLAEDGSFDVEGFRAAVEVVFTAQEIIVGNADYPTERIADNSRRFRELGIGYANLGALLMAQGLPYDSDGGRAWAASITALMTGRAYATSARTAARMGPFAGYHDNTGPMLDVLRMHRDAVAAIDEELVPPELLSAAQEDWDSAVELGEEYGVRNSQASVLAPTGTIGLLMDCDTTGVEPDLGLVKTKKLVGGGTMSIVNQTVPRALRRLGYGDGQIAAIVSYVDEHKTIVGAPGLLAEHLPVFACSMGDNTIHYLGHVRMMGAVQPFISGAISKTVNLPEEVSVEDVEQLHIDAWRMGIKAVAIYRDNCKVAQPLSTTKKEPTTGEGGSPEPAAGSEAEAHARLLSRRIADLEAALVHEQSRASETVVVGAVRERLPRRRKSNTFAFRVADCEGYVTVGEYEDGRPGEVFMKVSKQGSTLAGIMDAFSIAVSLGLQHGVPLATYVRKYTNMRFEPAGITDDPDLRIATSLVDYIFRRLAVDYLTLEERTELGVLSTSERMQPTLPGVEEVATTSSGVVESVPEGVDPVVATVVDASAPAPHPSEQGPAPSPMSVPHARVEPRDAPYCYQCGNIMQRAGSCFVCGSCGTTSGCS
jgi:ribonucleoside-diphosphate reductase alpha chain